MNLSRIACMGLLATLVSGCAVTSVSSDVSSFGEWPAGRTPGTYAYERLPSQQAMAADSDVLEAAAAPALAKAGFTPVAAGQQPDVLVQVGSRFQRSEDSRWDDRLWFSGGFGYGYYRRGPWLYPRWSLGLYGDLPRYDREVGLLIRDRESGKVLFEARATNEGLARSDPDLQAAMFQAALADFPRLGLNPRRVTVPVGTAN